MLTNSRGTIVEEDLELPCLTINGRSHTAKEELSSYDDVVFDQFLVASSPYEAQTVLRQIALDELVHS